MFELFAFCTLARVERVQEVDQNLKRLFVKYEYEYNSRKHESQNMMTLKKAKKMARRKSCAQQQSPVSHRFIPKLIILNQFDRILLQRRVRAIDTNIRDTKTRKYWIQYYRKYIVILWLQL